MYAAFGINTLLKFVCLWAISYGTGNLVVHMGVKVNYTRKINHFALFFIPMYLDTIFPYQESLMLAVMGCVIGVFSLILYINPVRSRFQIANMMFLSFDRPEDRPHTLLWLSTQMAVA